MEIQIFHSCLLKKQTFSELLLKHLENVENALEFCWLRYMKSIRHN